MSFEKEYEDEEFNYDEQEEFGYEEPEEIIDEELIDEKLEPEEDILPEELEKELDHLNEEDLEQEEFERKQLEKEGQIDEDIPESEAKIIAPSAMKFRIKGPAVSPLLSFMRENMVDILKFIHLQIKYEQLLNKKQLDDEFNIYKNAFRKVKFSDLKQEILDTSDNEKRIKLLLEYNGINPLVIKKLFLQKKLDQETDNEKRKKILKKYNEILPTLSKIIVEAKLNYKMIREKKEKKFEDSEEMKQYKKYKKTKAIIKTVETVIKEDEEYEVIYEEARMIFKYENIPLSIGELFGSVQLILNEDDNKYKFTVIVTADVPKKPDAKSRPPNSLPLVFTTPKNIYEQMVKLRQEINNAIIKEDKTEINNAVENYKQFLDLYKMKRSYARFDHIMQSYNIFERVTKRYSDEGLPLGATYVMFTTGNKTIKLEKSILKRIVPMTNIAGIYDFPIKKIKISKKLEQLIKEKGIKKGQLKRKMAPMESFDIKQILQGKMSDHPMIKDIVKMKLDNAIVFKTEKKRTTETFGSYAKLFDKMTEDVIKKSDERYYDAIAQDYKLDQIKISKLNEKYQINLNVSTSNELVGDLIDLVNKEIVTLCRVGRKDFLRGHSDISLRSLIVNILWDRLKKRCRTQIHYYEDVNDLMKQLAFRFDVPEKRILFNKLFNEFLDNVKQEENSQWIEFMRNRYIIYDCEKLKTNEFVKVTYDYLMYKFSFVKGDTLLDRMKKLDGMKKNEKSPLTDYEQDLIKHAINDEDIKKKLASASPSKAIEAYQINSLEEFKKLDVEKKMNYEIKEFLTLEIKEKRNDAIKLLNKSNSFFDVKQNFIKKFKKQYKLDSNSTLTELIQSILKNVNKPDTFEAFIYNNARHLKLDSDTVAFLEFKNDITDHENQIDAIEEMLMKNPKNKNDTEKERDLLRDHAKNIWNTKLKDLWNTHREEFDETYRKYVSKVTNKKREELDELLFRIQQSKRLGDVVHTKGAYGIKKTFAPVLAKDLEELEILVKQLDTSKLDEVYVDFEDMYGDLSNAKDLDLYLSGVLFDYINTGRYARVEKIDFLKNIDIEKMSKKSLKKFYWDEHRGIKLSEEELKKYYENLQQNKKIKIPEENISEKKMKKYFRRNYAIYFAKFAMNFKPSLKQKSPQEKTSILDIELFSPQLKLNEKRNKLMDLNIKISNEKKKITNFMMVLKNYFDYEFWLEYGKSQQAKELASKLRNELYRVPTVDEIKKHFWDIYQNDIQQTFFEKKRLDYFFNYIFWPNISKQSDFQKFIDLVYKNEYDEMSKRLQGNELKEEFDKFMKNASLDETFFKRKYWKYYSDFVRNEFKKFDKTHKSTDEFDINLVSNKINKLENEKLKVLEEIRKLEKESLKKSPTKKSPTKKSPKEEEQSPETRIKDEIIMKFIDMNTEAVAKQIYPDEYYTQIVLRPEVENRISQDICVDFSDKTRFDSIKNTFIMNQIISKTSQPTKNANSIVESILKSLDKYDDVFTYLCKFFKIFMVVDDTSPLTPYSNIYSNLINGIITGKQAVTKMNIYDYFSESNRLILQKHIDDFTEPLLANMLDLIYQYITLLSPFTKIEYNFVISYPQIKFNK